MEFYVNNVDHKGRVFSRFYAAPNMFGKGFVVDGKNVPDIGDSCYDNNVVMTCATPQKRIPGKPATYKGWRTKKEAQAVADFLNGKES